MYMHIFILNYANTYWKKKPIKSIFHKQQRSENSGINETLQCIPFYIALVSEPYDYIIHWKKIIPFMIPATTSLLG